MNPPFAGNLNPSPKSRSFFERAKFTLSQKEEICAELALNDVTASIIFDRDNHYPRSIKLKTSEGAPIASVEVLEFFPENSKFKGLAKKLNLETYAPSNKGESLHLASWQYQVSNIEINSGIKESDLEFDPASVDQIYDQANKTTISVPH